MWKLIRVLSVVALASIAGIAVGCTGGEDTVKDYDPEVSEERSADYEQEMRDSMQSQGRPGGQ